MIDLHTHTNYSDGRQTVAELLQKAENQKLEYLSITDHNTVDAYAELNNPNIRNLFGGKIVNGIEVEFSYGDTYNEFLGYGVDVDIISQTEWFTTKHRQKNELLYVMNLLAVYRKLGFDLPDDCEFEKAVEQFGSGRPLLLMTLENEKNLEHAKQKLGIENAVEFRKWRQKEVLRPNGAYEIERPKSPDMHLASKLIRDAGGLVFMAHIFRVGEKSMKMLEYAIENKLIDGIEVYYQDKSTPHSPQQIELLLQICEKHGLFASGGSDAHRIDHLLSTLSEKQVSFVKRLKTQ